MFKPMLAKLIKEPFDDPDWIFEIKWDGYRALSYKSRTVKMLSRNDKSFNARFPSIVKELEQLPGSFVVDGEIVVLDRKGMPRFQLLQQDEQQEGTLLYYLFDILSYNGKDLRERPLLERKSLLQRLLGKRRWQHLRYSEHIERFGKALFKMTKQKRLEGIIAKKKDSAYASTRSGHWLKIKTSMRQEMVIGGFTKPRGSRKYFGAILVGVYDKGRLFYAGHVGGGFDQELLRTTYQRMVKLKTTKNPFSTSPVPNEQVTWIKPQLVCEVSFAEWTKEGLLRQPIFHGLRVDKSPKHVVRERFV